MDKVCEHANYLTPASDRMLCLEETPLDRELQATELARIMSNSYPNPVIFLGYVVTKPLASRRWSLAIKVRSSLLTSF